MRTTTRTGKGFAGADREALFARYLPMVRAAARRFARRLPSHVEVDDLVSAGMLGLTEAVRRYDGDGSERFDAYVRVRVDGAMVDHLRTLDPLTRDQRRQIQRVRQVENRLRQVGGAWVTEEDVAEAVGMPLEELRELRRTEAASRAGTIPAPAAEDDDGDGLDRVADTTWTDADEEIERREMTERMESAVERLPERLRTILTRYYKDGMLLREIGRRMGFSEARACQLHKQAIECLRGDFAAEAGVTC
jgi:RNA polymerase sigma factor for flagellar operon FliA